MNQDIQRKICLLTGATSGIGKETALGLARENLHLILVGRDPQKLSATITWLKEQTGAEQLDSLCADFSSLAEVRRLAAEYKQKYSRLDILINNAGAIHAEPRYTTEGFEQTWVTNHLSPALLTLELLDLLKTNPGARIINVASRIHRFASGPVFRGKQQQHYWLGYALGSYANAKIAMILFSHALARYLLETGVTVNSLHPGTVATGLAGGETGPLRSLFVRTLLSPFKHFLLTPRQGAETSLHLALSPEVAHDTGKYFHRCRKASTSARCNDAAAQDEMWRLTLEQLSLTSLTRDLAPQLPSRNHP